MWGCIYGKEKEQILVVGVPDQLGLEGSVTWFDMQTGMKLGGWRGTSTIRGVYVPATNRLVMISKDEVFVTEIINRASLYTYTRTGIGRRDKSDAARLLYVYAIKDSDVVQIVADDGTCEFSTTGIPRSAPAICSMHSRMIGDGFIEAARIDDHVLVIRQITIRQLIMQEGPKIIAQYPIADGAILLGVVHGNRCQFLVQIRNEVQKYCITMVITRHGDAPDYTWTEREITRDHVTAITRDHVYFADYDQQRSYVHNLAKGETRPADIPRGSTHLCVSPTHDGTQILGLSGPIARIDNIHGRYCLYPHPTFEVDTDELFGDIKSAAKTS